MLWNEIFNLVLDCITPIAWLILFIVSKGKINKQLKNAAKADKYVAKAEKLLDKANKYILEDNNNDTCNN